MLATFRKHKEFIPKLFAIASPIILQNLVSSSMNYLDILMVGKLGVTEVAAVGIGNKVFFLFFMFIFSIASGAAIFTAQYWGNKDVKKIHAMIGIGLFFTLIISILASLLVFIIPDKLVYLFNTDIKVIKLGAEYTRIIGISLVITSLTILYGSVLRSTENVKLPMVVGLIGIVTNTGLNYLLIFGNYGFPELRVTGAAIATVIARFIEFALLYFLSYLRKDPTAARLRSMLNFDLDIIKKYIKTTLPVLGQGLGWALGYSMYSVIYGHMSTEALASYEIACTIERICLMLFLGFGFACAIMVGNRIGAGEEEKARDYSKNFLYLSIFSAIIISIILIFSRRYLIDFYNLTYDARLYLYYLLLVMACILIARTMNIIFIMGILKAGGDTFVSMLIDTGGIWLVGVPLAATAAFIWELPVYYVMALAATEEFVKMAACFYRFISGKWLHNLTKE